MKTLEKNQLREEAREALLKRYLTPGTLIYTQVRHVSASGMSRDVSLYVVRNGRIDNLTYYAANILGWRLVERNGFRAIRVQGLGMDMGYHLVESLAIALYGLEGRNSLRQEWL